MMEKFHSWLSLMVTHCKGTGRSAGQSERNEIRLIALFAALVALFALAPAARALDADACDVLNDPAFDGSYKSGMWSEGVLTLQDETGSVERFLFPPEYSDVVAAAGTTIVIEAIGPTNVDIYLLGAVHLSGTANTDPIEHTFTTDTGLDFLLISQDGLNNLTWSFTCTTGAGGDETPPDISPVISGTLGNNGWYVSDVIIEWSVSDDESSVTSTTGCDPTVVTTDTAGITLTCDASSAGGSNSSSVSIKRDATSPQVEVKGVVDGENYILGAVPAPACGTSDGLSGVATTATLSIEGGETDGTGTFTAVCDGASDHAGNTGSASATYEVNTPVEAIQDLDGSIQELIAEGALKQNQANGLLRPLDNAIRSLEKQNLSDACNQLQDFIDEVAAKTPDPLDTAKADDLIKEAQTIKSALGC